MEVPADPTRDVEQPADHVGNALQMLRTLEGTGAERATVDAIDRRLTLALAQLRARQRDR